MAQTKVDDLAKQSKGVKQNGTGKLQTPVELTLTRTLTQTLTLTLRNGTGTMARESCKLVLKEREDRTGVAVEEA